MTGTDFRNPRGRAAAARQLVTNHYLHLPTFADRTVLSTVATLADHARWRDLPTIDGPVAQYKSEASLQLPPNRAIDYVIKAIQDLLHDTPHQRWEPNEYVLNRYNGPRSGITAHRDSRRYTGVIAVLTITGEATFAIHRTRHDHPATSRTVRPGDLMLLEGSQAGESDHRPFHSVTGPATGNRVSLTLRRTEPGRRTPTMEELSDFGRA